MTLQFVASNSCTSLAYSMAKHLNVPICRLLCYQKNNRQIGVLIGELLNCDEIFILQTATMELKSINDMILELMFIIHFCKSNSSAKLSVGNQNYTIEMNEFVCSDALLSLLETR